MDVTKLSAVALLFWIFSTSTCFASKCDSLFVLSFSPPVSFFLSVRLPLFLALVCSQILIKIICGVSG